LSFLTHIRGHDQSFATSGSDLASGGLSRGLVALSDDHTGTLGGEAKGNTSSDTTPTTCDNSDFVL
jgi:hypothetical protein